jgi:serine/threonine protein kinase
MIYVVVHQSSYTSKTIVSPLHFINSQEIAAMQLVGDDLPGVMGCSEVLYVSGRDVLDQVAKQQQQQQTQGQAKTKLFQRRKYPPSDREEDNDTINVVMRYCQHGDMFDALQQPWRGSTTLPTGAGAAAAAAAAGDVIDQRPGFSEPQARFWFRQIMQGIRDLHDKGVCHVSAADFVYVWPS